MIGLPIDLLGMRESLHDTGQPMYPLAPAMGVIRRHRTYPHPISPGMARKVLGCRPGGFAKQSCARHHTMVS